jgi:plastin-3
MKKLSLQSDTNTDGFIDLREMKDALDGCGFKIPLWRVLSKRSNYAYDATLIFIL